LHYKYKNSYDKAWVAKQKVIKHLFGSHEEYFKKLQRLLSAIKESNPGTVVEWTCKGNLDDSIMVFRRVFWSFGSCVKSFEYYRPLISVDDTCLHEWYDEKLLIAVTFGANTGLFPLAFAIINKENNYN
jgi:hypothetical protein